MDQRLLDAAKLGDIIELQNILKEDPLVLEEFSITPFAQTPLHVAALAGKDDFVKEIIKLMPSFAREINEKGLSPMHIACAKGYLEIVRELLKLKLDINLCLVKDKHGRNPLHYAIIKGKVDVVKMLISDCPQSLEEVTAQNETVLHLAVKVNQFEALKVLIERLKELNLFESLFCAKDKEGSTVWELAEVRNQTEVQDLLKGKGITTNAGNIKANRDIEEEGDSEEKKDKSADMNIIVVSESAASGNDTETITIGIGSVGDGSNWNILNGVSIEMKSAVLIMAIFVATLCYQAVVTPPPTIWNVGTKLDTQCLFKKPYRYLFFPRSYVECPAANFYYFLISNTAGFVFSLSTILIFSPAHSLVRVALVFVLLPLVQNYFTLLRSITPDALSAKVILDVGLIVLVVLQMSTVYGMERIFQIFTQKTSKTVLFSKRFLSLTVVVISIMVGFDYFEFVIL